MLSGNCVDEKSIPFLLIDDAIAIILKENEISYTPIGLSRVELSLLYLAKTISGAKQKLALKN